MTTLSKTKWLNIAYLTLLIIAAWATETQQMPIHYVAKTLLMPILMYMVYIHRLEYSKLVLRALFFAWLGGICIMVDHLPKMFLLGLFSYLIGHLYYIFLFNRSGVINRPLNVLFSLMSLSFFYIHTIPTII